MKKVFLAIAVCFLIFVSCDSDSGNNSWGNSTVCEGTIEFINNSTNPYTVSVSGYGSFVLGGKKYTERSYEKGSYSIYVKQNSGYLFYPTEETYTVRVSCGSYNVVSFPQ